MQGSQLLEQTLRPRSSRTLGSVNGMRTLLYMGAQNVALHKRIKPTKTISTFFNLFTSLSTNNISDLFSQHLTKTQKYS